MDEKLVQYFHNSNNNIKIAIETNSTEPLLEGND